MLKFSSGGGVWGISGSIRLLFEMGASERPSSEGVDRFLEIGEIGAMIACK